MIAELWCGETRNARASPSRGKGRGWSDKAIREILKIRKQKKEEFQENAALLEVYMQSLGMI